MKAIGSLLKLVLWLIVVLAVCLLVWFAAPLLAFADVHPFETPLARGILIGLLLLLWFGKRVLAAAIAGLRNRKLFDSMKRKPEAAPADAQEAAHAATLRKRFGDAVDVMRELRIGGARGGWFGRLFGGQRYVYQLPWYLFIGPPGSGKTTALMKSGLQFPLAERLGEDPVRGVGGTRHCDWWFTDRAVLIDTAGRYTTQDSNAEADAREWTDFLALLKKYRPRQPINGVLVTVSVPDLLLLPSAALERQAQAVRARIQELVGTLQNSFPVYLLVTKTDLLSGFTDFFQPLDGEQRAQVWGTTFPYRERDTASLDRAAAGERFDGLVARLDALAFERIHEERDPTRRSIIHAFPDQFAALRPALFAFLEQAFPASRLAHPVPVRGLYFTSGTQEGTPIDRVLGTLTRGFGLRGGGAAGPVRGTGKAFFLTRLLDGVIFAESPLAGTNLRWERRRAAIKWGGAALAGLVAIAAMIGWTWSYYNNSTYLDAVQAKVDVIRKAITENRLPSDPKSLMPLYSTLRELASTPAVDPANPPWSHRLGLDQSAKVAEGARQSYQRLLASTLAPVLGSRLTAVLRQSAPNPELQYETLKTYVMLTNPQRMNVGAVKGWIAFDMELNQAGTFTADERREMLEHVDALLARNEFQDALVLDERAVADARALLLRTPFAQRVYNRLKRQPLPRDIGDFRVERAAGPNGAVVFTRLSGKPLSEGVPALYTYDGYHRGFNKLVGDAIRELADEETWVLGVRDSDNARRAGELAGQQVLANEVRQLYFRDYINRWEVLIADVAVKRGATLSEIIQGTRVLSGTDSPLPRLMRAMVRETTLSASDGRPTADQVLDRTAEAAREAKERLEAMLGNRPAAAPRTGALRKPEQDVDDRFERLRQFVRAAPNGGKAPVDDTVALINDLYVMLTNIETALAQRVPPPQSDLPNRLKAEADRLPEPVRSMVGSMAAAGASQQQRELRQQVNTTLQTSISEFCNKAIGGRYPFTPGSQADVTPGDFARLFAPNGLLDDFFQKSLAPLVDTTSKPWRFRKVGDTPLPDSSSLVQFQRADAIRKVFFAAGPAAPAMRIEMQPVDMDKSILQFSLDADGQLIKYMHGPSVPKPIQWPGPNGTNQIRLQISPPGPSGASGAVFNGPWALFRLFEQAQLTGTGQPEKFRAVITIDGLKIFFDVTAASVQNPFRLPELQTFRCPNQL